MKTAKKLIAVALIIITVVAALFITNAFLTKRQDVYVGVTYCGDSVEDAKLLVDKVKDYTNLFILQSGTLQRNGTQIEQIGDYAVNSGLNYMVYVGIGNTALFGSWPSTYDGRWGDRFLGVYAVDEPGGKMLEGQTTLSDEASQSSMTKSSDGSLSGYRIDSDYVVTYMRNGSLQVESGSGSLPFDFITYRPDGTVIGTNRTFRMTSVDYSDTVLTDTLNLKYTYDQLWAAFPITVDEMENLYITWTSNQVNSERLHYNSTLNVVTADYALHWYDYQSGYDAVLAQFCWNQSITQDIALVRGAANLHGKDWGAMITWKYTEAPYLPNGEDMYQEMCSAYRNGAKYIAIFNYSPDMQGPYGILQQEHIEALQRFWTDMKNQNIKHNEVKADTAFVLPHGYGSGLRNQGDIVWGLWAANETDNQIWQHMQDALAIHGEKLDIVYEDSAYPVAGKYSQVIYWNQTG
jgi:hypothetical protein